MDYIERNKDRGFGQPVIVGTRLTVLNVLSNANNSESIQSFLEEYQLTLEEIKGAAFYCKNKLCKDIKSDSDRYCQGCILKSISEGWNSIKTDFFETDSISVSKDGKTFSLGSIEETENDEFGVIGWLVAEEVERKMEQ
jgi:uncharacterized protein (DUF433 family)